MTRCDYDGVFYRAFCITLLAIAFTFTVILTNVFIDIDGLLSSKEKEKSLNHEPTQAQLNNEVLFQPDDNKIDQKTDTFYDFKTERDDDDGNYHTQNFQFHVRNPKMKEILTHKLATLLEELDAEETQTINKIEKTKEHERSKILVEVDNVKMDDKKDKIKPEDDLLHLAMHNILLQGIIGHMDLNDVYKKVHQLVQNFDLDGKKKLDFRRKGDEGNKEKTLLKKKEDGSKEIIEIPKSLFSIESKFFDELTKCEGLKKQIAAETNEKLELLDTRRFDNTINDKGLVMKNPDEYDVVHVETLGKDTPHMLIKTIIDIKTLKNDHNKTSINENNIKGLIKLIYNGKPIKFTRMEDDEEKKKTLANSELDGETQKLETDLLQDENGNILDTYLDQAINKYLTKYPKLEKKFKNKRLKRNVKVRPRNVSDNDSPRSIVTTDKPKHKKNEEEELYVEIETHFDGKGIKGEKKKKLVKDLVEKIQKAIHSDLDSLQEIAKHARLKHRKGKRGNNMMHIKKRLQNPFEIREENLLKNKIIIPFNRVVHRDSHPISKAVQLSEPMPKVYDKFGENWKKTYQGSTFLSNTKAINSGEFGLVDLDYSKVLGDSGIPQRLQQPLNTDNVEQTAEPDDSYFNLGDLKFYIKDIDGTGFSIGFNQYVGEAPDPESIKLFTGLQQLIKTYHQNYDETGSGNEANNTETGKSTDASHEMRKRDVSRAKRPDYHSNEYKIVFDNHYLPYDTYSEIFEDKNKKVTLSLERQNKVTNVQTLLDSRIKSSKRQELLPFIIDDNIFKKQLKPSEIFGLANLLDRKKRSPKVTVKKYSNLKTRSRSKLNRFLNTNRMNKRLIMSKNKRSKRQIDKIRIIATDNMPHLQRHSDENIFVMSDENVFADRAVVREVELPDPEDQEEHVPIEYLNPHRIYDHSTQSFKFGSQPSYTDFFSARSRHNALMSKYPHLFLEEISRSKEEESPFFYTKLMGNFAEFKNLDTTASPFVNNPVVLPTQQATGDMNLPSGSKPNYKLTVKIVPKNSSDIDSGFKEIYTSINKSINRNGLLYSSQVNVSEVSKVENIDQKNKQEKASHPPQPDLRYVPMETKQEIKQEPKQELKPESKPVYQPPPLPYNPCNNSPPVNLANVGVPMPVPATGDKTESSTSYFPLVKHIREQQEKMKQLLKQHRKRIDDQLDTLKREKQNIESIIVPNEKEKKTDIIDVMLPLNPPQMLHLNKAEAGQLITSALMKLHDAPQLNDISLNGIPLNASSSLMESITTKLTTLATTTTEKPKMDMEKQKILKTIQKNENLTNIILYKIDKNTNLLQLFLEKLSDKLLPVTPKQEYTYIPPEAKPRTNDFNHLKEWKESYEPFFSKTMPNLEVRKNDTHVSIPFVYAYQQPFPLPNKPNSPVASVVYQGHIHTNTNYNNNAKRPGDYAITRDEKTRKTGPTIKREVNVSRFFVDNIQNDYKVSPIDVKKAYDNNMARTRYNLTKTYT
ncbi:uncharacterized protein LOC126379076 [Pectinophora gossypiella]|uniref:uncharacterized protein LOC126379076 n=1 Tax=Pectinophora gossypiella TaxID=13191 RepID=UPI00214E481F|nr:uncharacterized protein LOC126379076 [Pectinophora gossypiella]